MRNQGFAQVAHNDNRRLYPVLSEFDRRCTACQGTGQEAHPQDPYFGTDLIGCSDCQGTGEVPPPYDMSGEARTEDDLDAEEAMEREANG
jgi:DnaJ-class molecular chaperone